ncbi:unnamed protein product [Vicia faba]|uniref:Reverse transcriptase zinc-binding domain-containing protein n=1 Tax=Vicia faba TaxID=3906 RepID=A0AAV0ZDE3_VICFA|nr:unnamed protein product [Vicia faba]
MYGMDVDNSFYFCDHEENIQHLFFGCDTLKLIWKNMLAWIQVRHEPAEWDEKLNWLCRKGKSSSWKSMLLKLAATETVYNVWKHRNETIFQKEVKDRNIENDIIENIVYRG